MGKNGKQPPSTDNSEQFICPECGQKCRDKRDLGLHRWRAHKVHGPWHASTERYRRRIRAGLVHTEKMEKGRADLQNTVEIARDVGAALREIVELANLVADLAETGMGAGNSILNAIRPLRQRYMKLRSQQATLCRRAKKYTMNEDDDEVDLELKDE